MIERTRVTKRNFRLCRCVRGILAEQGAVSTAENQPRSRQSGSLSVFPRGAYVIKGIYIHQLAASRKKNNLIRVVP